MEYVKKYSEGSSEGSVVDVSIIGIFEFAACFVAVAWKHNEEFEFCDVFASGPMYDELKSLKITALHIDPRYEQTQLDAVKETMVRSKHGGYIYIRYSIDKFDLPSPHDASQVHVCMVYEPQRCTLEDYKCYFPPERSFDDFYFKWILRFILSGLSYLHSACGLIHGDVKEENILMSM